MKTESSTWTNAAGWEGDHALRDADMVLFFAGPDPPDGEAFATLRERYPTAKILGCTTGGEIAGADVLDGSVSAIAIDFDAVAVRGATFAVESPAASFDAGCALAESLASEGLRAVFVLSDGTKVNGTDLVRGLRSKLGDDVVVTGGLAGDGAAFGATRVGLDEAPLTGRIAAIGLYGSGLVIGCGSAGGWVPFGPERLVTKSNGNVLLELDNKPALDLYTKYLGEEAARLPSSALLFPLVIRRDDGSAPIVRTIVGVDDDAHTMTFAGDVPEGAIAQLMRASHDELVDGAAEAASTARSDASNSFAVLVSCIGRKLLMGQSTADEVEAVANVLGAACPTIGFYSYGEIAPSCGGFSDLHNQTMTITTFSEKLAA